MLEEFDTWKLLAGLGIFLFGMFLMEESVKNLAGRAFKRFIREYTSGKLKSIASGTFVTAILQSSSAVSLMVLTFAGAGIMSMENAIGVILGSNLGTTFTAWIVAVFGFKLDIESFALPLIGIGGLGLILLGKSTRYSNISKLLVGFGFLFMGLDYMKSSVSGITEVLNISELPDYGILFYLLMGLLLTAVMQSSSATIAIILTALNAALISFSDAAAMVIGANVGTTVTVLIGSIGGTQVKKRVAFSHLTFNIFTAIIGLILLPVFVWLIHLFIGGQENQEVVGVALFHSLFNLTGVLIFLPFIAWFSKLLLKAIPDRKTEVTHYINNLSPDVSEAAIVGIKKEVSHLIQNTLRFNLRVMNIDESLVFTQSAVASSGNKKIRLDDQYSNLKLLQAEIFTFSTGIQQQQELSKEEADNLHRYLHAARMTLLSAKTIKDIKHNFDEFENADNDYLNRENAAFRRRMISLYLDIIALFDEEENEGITAEMVKLLNRIKNEDVDFMKGATAAISKKQISDLNIATILTVNRAFVQSSRQIIFAIRDVLLEPEESRILDRLLEEDLPEK